MKTRYRLAEGTLRDRIGDAVAGSFTVTPAGVLEVNGKAVGLVTGITVEAPARKLTQVSTWFPHTPSIGRTIEAGLSSSSGQELSDKLPQAPALFDAPSEPERQLSEVWTHYQQTIPNGLRYELTTRRKRCIKRALDVRSVDECKRAITGLSLSDFHAQRKYLDIEYALGLRTEDPDARIDKMASNVPEFPGSSSVPSDEPATLRRETEIALDDLAHKVSLMLERPFGVNLADGTGAIETLARYGLEIALDEARTRVVRLSVVPVEDARIMRVQPLLAERLQRALGLV